MMPPLIEEIGKAAIRHKEIHANSKLKAYEQLRDDLEELRSKVAAKISAWSDGDDDEAASQFNITLLVFQGIRVFRSIRHGYSANGLYRAVINGKNFEDERKGYRVEIRLIERGTDSPLPAALVPIVRELAKTPADLADWCREFMQDFKWE
ncbi:hypothetical protein HFO61_30325 [Rhizobium leguminosarum]|uniref:hypothetical protein n=1 Tax=Rhizobium leguminosarum TaxID=384 RepID=UPI001C98BA93|nr:hypothetical protein [Rhizobium leguminosarum]MBY5551044.1 hypothetical protein [Rhizobium leguminosarum]